MSKLSCKCFCATLCGIFCLFFVLMLIAGVAAGSYLAGMAAVPQTYDLEVCGCIEYPNDDGECGAAEGGW